MMKLQSTKFELLSGPMTEPCGTEHKTVSPFAVDFNRLRSLLQQQGTESRGRPSARRARTALVYFARENVGLRGSFRRNATRFVSGKTRRRSQLTTRRAGYHGPLEMKGAAAG